MIAWEPTQATTSPSEGVALTEAAALGGHGLADDRAFATSSDDSSQRSEDAASKKTYAQMRARGHSHGRALRGMADRWLKVLTAMLSARTLYDPLHKAA